MKKALFLIIMFIFYNSNIWAKDQTIDYNNPSDKLLILALDNWKKAILSKNYDVLLNFALPEYKDGIKKELLDKTSKLYKAIYLQKNCLNKILKSNNLKTLIGKIEMGASLVYFYNDSRRTKPDNNISAPTMTELVKEGKAFAITFTNIDNKYYVSYEFAEEGD